MRRFFFSLAFLTLATTGPMQAFGGDREIAEQIIQRLKVQRDAGTLKGFTLDLKVEEGVVLMRGRVSAAQQKASVMAATEGIEGVAKVVDEISVATAETKPQPVKPAEPTAPAPVESTAQAPAASTAPAPAASPATQQEGFSFREALAAEAAKRSATQAATVAMPNVAPAIAANQGAVVPAAASEEDTATGDSEITSAVVRSLGKAQKEGRLRGFGVDVTTRGGDVWLSGRASNQQHKQLIMELAQSVSGVNNVIDDITVYAAKPADSPATGPVRPTSQTEPARKMPSNLQPVAVEPAARPVSNTVDQGPVAAAVPYRMPQGGGHPYAAAGHPGVAVPGPAAMGQPVPAAPYPSAMAAPRYDQPYMPNYAWPGYAAYPNYAAVTYPQQYSPSAWPYIGPFYPYPQVPLGWRKVSLEWDDGWWFLDFTDR